MKNVVYSPEASYNALEKAYSAHIPDFLFELVSGVLCCLHNMAIHHLEYVSTLFPTLKQIYIVDTKICAELKSVVRPVDLQAKCEGHYLVVLICAHI